jgi:hypothetical protein
VVCKAHTERWAKTEPSKLLELPAPCVGTGSHAVATARFVMAAATFRRP